MQAVEQRDNDASSAEDNERLLINKRRYRAGRFPSGKLSRNNRLLNRNGSALSRFAGSPVRRLLGCPLKRCPGAASQYPPDGSAPFLDTGGLDCQPSEVPPGP